MGSVDLNSGPHSGMANALPTYFAVSLDLACWDSLSKEEYDKSKASYLVGPTLVPESVCLSLSPPFFEGLVQVWVYLIIVFDIPKT